MSAWLVNLFAATIGVAGGVASGGFRASGKAGLALGLIAAAGAYLSVVFC
jgi:hypothetical protein